MISFECDYIKGAHPAIIQKLAETNLEALSGYGFDPYTESAKAKIRKACGIEDADVEFLVGGTQANAVVISTMLRDYEGVIAAESGHVNVHESGAIEFTGHKVLAIPGVNGKLEAATVRSWIEDFYEDVTHENMVYPGMVYISHPTEVGTLYSKAELEELSKLCKDYEIPLFLDGARLGYGLMSDNTDVTLEDIARLTDVFYIGGTKVGALCGEAVVFTKNNKPKHFYTSCKKRGAILAKGRLTGVQFDVLFTDNLYFDISRHAIVMAGKLRKILEDKGWEFYMDSPTNQQFVLLDAEQMARVREYVNFDVWGNYDETRKIVRFATSWSTTDEDLDALARV